MSGYKIITAMKTSFPLGSGDPSYVDRSSRFDYPVPGI